MNWWNTMKRMAEEEGAAGEGGGASAPAAGTPAPAPAAEPAAPAAGADPAPAAGEAKPFLGDAKTDAPAASAKDSATPVTISDEDYMKSCVIDEKVVNLKGAKLDADLFKEMIPTAKELGVNPESLGKLANALCAAQVERGRELMQDRIQYFQKMKSESMEKYSSKDFETINAGIDRWFKPNGVMNNVIRNSELGADPEFLALMFELGKRAQTDDLAGASSGGGGASVDPNGTEGLAKMW